MKNAKFLKCAMILCALILIAAVVVALSGILNAAGFTYEHADKYTAGDAEIAQPVRNLDIHWVDGRVNVTYHSGTGISLTETSEKPIGDDLRMRWWVDGDTLRVQYARSGFRLSLNPRKTLTLSLPEGAVFDSVSISATSGDLSIPALQAERLTLSTTSGDIDAAATVRRVAAGVTSGNVSLALSGSAEAAEASATSGNIRLTLESADSVNASTTSGLVSVSGESVTSLKAASTSGNVTLDIGRVTDADVGSTSGTVTAAFGAFSAVKVAATSGDVRLSLPEDPGFTAKLATVSGGIHYDLPLSRQSDRYVCGDGSGSLDVGTTSGSIQLQPAAQ